MVNYNFISKISCMNQTSIKLIKAHGFYIRWLIKPFLSSIRVVNPLEQKRTLNVPFRLAVDVNKCIGVVEFRISHSFMSNQMIKQS